MIESKKLWKELIRILSVKGQPTKAILSHTRTGIFFILSVSDIILVVLFLSTQSADHLANSHGPPVIRGPQFEKLCTNISQPTLAYCIDG
jgi:hypothetical protein